MHKTPNLAHLSTPRCAQARLGLCRARSASPCACRRARFTRPCACCRAPQRPALPAPVPASARRLRSPRAQPRPYVPSAVPRASALRLLAQRPRAPGRPHALRPRPHLPACRPSACAPASPTPLRAQPPTQMGSSPF